jgi:hypothetical protein
MIKIVRIFTFLFSFLLFYIAIQSSQALAESQGIEIVSHDEGGLVHGDWWLNVQVIGNVSRVRVSVGGGSPIDLVEVLPGNFSIVIDTTSHDDGSYEVQITAQGEGTDPPTDQVTVNLVIDNTPPEMDVAWGVDNNTSRPFEVSLIFRDDHLEGSEAWVEVSDHENLKIPLSSAPVGFYGTVDIVQVSEGLHTFKVLSVDGAGNVAESEGRQVMVWKFPDLAPIEFDWVRNEYQTPGETYNRSYMIRNKGFEDSGPFEVAFQVEGITEITYNITRSLGPNETFKGYVVWSPQREGTFNLSINVDPFDAIEELDEENNVLTIREGFREPGGCYSMIPIMMVPSLLLLLLIHHTMSQNTRRINRSTRVEASSAPLSQ